MATNLPKKDNVVLIKLVNFLMFILKSETLVQQMNLML